MGFFQSEINDTCDRLLFVNDVCETKDHLEAFRVSLQQQHKVQDEVIKKVLSSVSHGPNRTFYWLCQLASTLTADREESMSSECDRISDQLYNAILCHRAERHGSDWALRFLRDHHHSDNKKVVKEIAQWECKSCQSPEDSKDKFEDCVKCVKGHVWARCVLTLRPCDEASVAWCEWCEAPALNSYVQANPDVTCPLCDGEFTTQ